MKAIAKFIFWLFGWRIAGKPPTLKKYVAILAPHTSGWDLIFGLCARYIFGLDIKLMAKEEIFRFPMGPLLRAMGGIPVDRSSKHNMVDQAVALFNTRENFILAIAPEGTRKYVAKWKTGFYYIALKAQVPIVFAYLDYATKTVGIGPAFYPTGDIEKDMETILAFYRPIKGKHPEEGVR